MQMNQKRDELTSIVNTENTEMNMFIYEYQIDDTKRLVFENTITII